MPLAWIDVENPPQVQYLSPFERVFQERGFEVVVTARDYGETLSLLRIRGIVPFVVGKRFGRSPVRKAVGTLVRAVRLVRLFGVRKPDFLLGVSRSSVLAARFLRCPAFTILDYEYVEIQPYRWAQVHLFFPAVIAPEVFRQRGFPSRRLHPFPGLKEDLTFAGIDFSAYPSALRDDGRILVLLRPPAEESHYFREEYRGLTRALLDFLTTRGDVRLVFSPRYSYQVRELHRRRWRVSPLVLERPIPVLSLMKSVDLVISSGGTMVREAAYLGVPAYSLFLGPLGGVDRYLAEQGRLVLLRTPQDFHRIDFRKRGGEGFKPLGEGKKVLQRLTEEILDVLASFSNKP